MESAIVRFERKGCGAVLRQGESGKRSQEVEGIQNEEMGPPRRQWYWEFGD